MRRAIGCTARKVSCQPDDAPACFMPGRRPMAVFERLTLEFEGGQFAWHSDLGEFGDLGQAVFERREILALDQR